MDSINDWKYNIGKCNDLRTNDEIRTTAERAWFNLVKFIRFLFLVIAEHFLRKHNNDTILHNFLFILNTVYCRDEGFAHVSPCCFSVWINASSKGTGMMAICRIPISNGMWDSHNVDMMNRTDTHTVYPGRISWISSATPRCNLPTMSSSTVLIELIRKENISVNRRSRWETVHKSHE